MVYLFDKDKAKAPTIEIPKSWIEDPKVEPTFGLEKQLPRKYIDFCLVS